MIPLASGNYVVPSPNWDNGAAADAGAATWGSGTTGVVGAVSASNSLVGSTAGDRVGGQSVVALPGGNYVVRSPNWANGPVANAGAATWGSGATGVVGVVSASNSLVGSTTFDFVGGSDLIILTNGNYLVRIANWDNGPVADAGAATWGSGTTGVSGVVSAANSLVGTTAEDRVGSAGVVALPNGNYVVRSQDWDNGPATNAGAATWGNGATGTVGVVSASNSLVGSSAFDGVGSDGVTALPNGNYVVRMRDWANGAAAAAGAVTWGNGTTGIVGVVSASNSLVGSTAGDRLGASGVTVLANGNYLVRSTDWTNGAAAFAGAVTWGNGTTGTVGVVSASNSLVGSTAIDVVGSSGVTALANGNYVVGSENWDNGPATNAGAVTWGNGATGTTGVVSPANSLVGSTANDRVGTFSVVALANGNYVVTSRNWDNGPLGDAGAMTWADGTTGIVGTISAANSAVGLAASTNLQSTPTLDAANNQFYARFVFEGGGRVRAGSQFDGFGPTTVTPLSTAVRWGSSGTSGALVTQGDGLRLLPAGRSNTLPWLGVNRLLVTLSHPVALSPGDVTVTGVAVANYGPVTISRVGTSYTITLGVPISAADRVTVTIAGALASSYTRRLDVLPGDVNDDGSVNAVDAAVTRSAALGGVVAVPVLFLDVNGDGVVDLTDFNAVRARSGQRLP